MDALGCRRIGSVSSVWGTTAEHTITKHSSKEKTKNDWNKNTLRKMKWGNSLKITMNMMSQFKQSQHKYVKFVKSLVSLIKDHIENTLKYAKYFTTK